MNSPLTPNDPRLPAVRARLFLLVRSLWKAGVVQVPLALQPSEAPALRLLHPLWQRLRVELLGEQLLRDVLPPIERHLASEGTLHRAEEGLAPSSPVDWPATWRRSLGRPGTPALVTRRWQRLMELPENRLAARALAEIEVDAVRGAGQSATAEESGPLRHLAARAAAALARPPWRGLAAGWDEATAGAAAQRIRERLAARPAYAALLAWWQGWRGWQQPIGGPQPLLDPALEPDWLFELILLFEVVAGLAQHFPTRQSRALAEHGRAPIFVAGTPRGPVALFYRTGTMFSAHRSLEGVWGIPDIVLQLPGDPPGFVILDAKNYGPSGHTQALYKMLGYLYQFGYDAAGTHRFDQVRAGILAFPTEEREGTGLRNWQRELPGAQAVMGFTLPPLAQPRYTGLAELILWLRRQLEGAHGEVGAGAKD